VAKLESLAAPERAVAAPRGAPTRHSPSCETLRLALALVVLLLGQVLLLLVVPD
jgi:hypothetical protein